MPSLSSRLSSKPLKLRRLNCEKENEVTKITLIDNDSFQPI